MRDRTVYRDSDGVTKSFNSKQDLLLYKAKRQALREKKRITAKMAYLSHNPSQTPIYKIPYPQDNTEFEIQCTIVTGLRNHGIDARGEVRGSDGCRFDIVIFKDKYPVEIVEIKTSQRKSTRFKDGFLNEDKAQLKRYEQYGIPITMIYGLEQAKKFILDANKKYIE